MRRNKHSRGWGRRPLLRNETDGCVKHRQFHIDVVFRRMPASTRPLGRVDIGCCPEAEESASRPTSSQSQHLAFVNRPSNDLLVSGIRI